MRRWSVVELEMLLIYNTDTEQQLERIGCGYFEQSCCLTLWVHFGWEILAKHLLRGRRTRRQLKNPCQFMPRINLLGKEYWSIASIELSRSESFVSRRDALQISSWLYQVAPELKLVILRNPQLLIYERANIAFSSTLLNGSAANRCYMLVQSEQAFVE